MKYSPRDRVEKGGKKMKYRYVILISFLIGAIALFFLKMFPIPLWNIEHTAQSIWWNNGLMNYFNWNVLFIPLIGGLAGTLFTIPFMPKKI